MKKVALWKVLQERHHIPRDQSERLVLAGKVRVGNARARGVGVPIDPATPISIVEEPRYVSRGGEKLTHALTDLNVDVRGKVVLDAGAAAGGFTDCLLQHGAKLVYAVDTGFGQLAGKLRTDSRVVVYERTNIGDPRLIALSPQPAVATLDLSYLSLRVAVPIVSELMAERGKIVALVKPLFETEDHASRRTGKLSRHEARSTAEALASDLRSLSYRVSRPIDSPIAGGKGTVEFFILIELGDDR